MNFVMFSFYICKVLFCALLILGAVGIKVLASYLEAKTKLPKAARSFVLGIFCLAIVVALTLTWIFVDPCHIAEEKLAYQVESYDRQEKIIVKDIIKEQGKEPIYKVGCFWGTWEIPEADYKAYIGNENNAVTLHFEKVTVYVSHSVLSHDFDASHTYSLYRISHPWEPEASAFNNEEVNEFKDGVLALRNVLYSKDKISRSNFSFEFDNWATGMCHVNCLDRGAVRFR